NRRRGQNVARLAPDGDLGSGDARPAAHIGGIHCAGHHTLPAVFSALEMKARAAMLTRMVMANSTTPRAMRAARKTSLASPNWLAMTDAMASPARNKFSVIRGNDPITTATPIVSPMAPPLTLEWGPIRPRPAEPQ